MPYTQVEKPIIPVALVFQLVLIKLATGTSSLPVGNWVWDTSSIPFEINLDDIPVQYMHTL